MELENNIENYFVRFADVSIEKFLRTELLILNQRLPKETQPRRSNEKEPSKGVIEFRNFVSGLLSVSEHLINTVNLPKVPFVVSKQIYDFFHMEDKMRPLMALNEPVSFPPFFWPDFSHKKQYCSQKFKIFSEIKLKHHSKFAHFEPSF